MAGFFTTTTNQGHVHLMHLRAGLALIPVALRVIPVTTGPIWVLAHLRSFTRGPSIIADDCYLKSSPRYRGGAGGRVGI